MATPADIKIAPASVTYKTVDLGNTKGGVTVSVDTDYTDVTTDQFGSSMLDKRALGEHVTVTVPLVEYTQANIGTALPLSTDVSGSRKNLGSLPGTSMLGLSGRLVIRPVGTSGAEDIIVHKAVVEDVADISISPEEERITEVTFRGFIDTTRTAGDYLVQFGDSTA